MDVGWWAGWVASAGRIAAIVAIVWWGTSWTARRIAQLFAQSAYDQTFGASFRLRLPATCAAACLAGIIIVVIAILIEYLQQPNAQVTQAISLTLTTICVVVPSIGAAGWFVWSTRSERKRMSLLVAGSDPLRQTQSARSA